MKEIKQNLLKLFQNEKILEIFSNSDSQGLIVINMERLLSFKEIVELDANMNLPLNQQILEKYDTYPNVKKFISLIE